MSQGPRTPDTKTKPREPVFLLDTRKNRRHLLHKSREYCFIIHAHGTTEKSTWTASGDGISPGSQGRIYTNEMPRGKIVS